MTTNKQQQTKLQKELVPLSGDQEKGAGYEKEMLPK
jgi:hypothetical protein